MTPMPLSVSQLSELVAEVVIKYPNAIVRSALHFPNHWLIFINNENVVAQLCIETGELEWNKELNGK